MRIKEVLEKIGTREIPCVPADAEIDEVIRVLALFHHTRVVYVLGPERRLLGTIGMGRLLRHIYPHLYEGKIHAHGMLRRLTARTAAQLMDKQSPHATAKETVEDVLARMGRTGVEEMAVLDAAGAVLGDLTLADLLRYYYLESQGKQPPG